MLTPVDFPGRGVGPAVRASRAHTAAVHIENHICISIFPEYCESISEMLRVNSSNVHEGAMLWWTGWRTPQGNHKPSCNSITPDELY